jgi:VanZ family protein
MKKALIVFFMITNIVSAQIVQQDKLLHAGGCYVMSSSVAALVYNKTNDKKKSLLYGFGVSVLAGVAKEVYDIRCGDPDVKDIAADIVGAGLGVITIRITL